MTKPIHAGYVVFPKVSAEAIYGYGRDCDEAWNDFKREMGLAGITMLDEGEKLPCDDAGFPYPDTVRFEDYEIASASKELLALVERDGGAVSWSRVGGVCCTREEKDRYHEA